MRNWGPQKAIFSGDIPLHGPEKKLQLPSGYVKIAIENDPVEIMDFPMKNGGSFHSYVKLPEGSCNFSSAPDWNGEFLETSIDPY